MRLNFRTLGEGPPMVVMHGVFGSSDNWLTTSKGLAENNKIFLLDLRNHGQSPHSDEFNYEKMALDLNEFLDEHQIKDPVVLGHSMGGKVAMRFARDFQNYSKLIVVDISPRYYRKHHDAILEGMHALDLKTLVSRNDADAALAKFVPELGVRQFLLKNLYRNEKNEFAWRLNLPVITEQIENVGEALPEGTKITKPTLFIKGAESRYIQEKDDVIIRNIFTDVRVETIQGSGHWVQAERPKEFLEVVKRFL